MQINVEYQQQFFETAFARKRFFFMQYP